MMARIAQSLGPDVVACVAGNAGPNRLATADGEIRVYRCPRVFQLPQNLQSFALLPTLTSVWWRERPRLVQLATCSEGYIGLGLRRTLDLPFIVYAHGNEILAAQNTAWKRPVQALRAAQCVIANSRFTAQLLARCGVAEVRIRVVHPGCDAMAFRPLAGAQRLRDQLFPRANVTWALLTVANLVERKGHDMVIKALARLAASLPGLGYVIVGAGPHQASLENLAAQSGITDRVAFAGLVPDERLPEYYAACDAFIMPSRMRPEHDDVEGFGIVFIEASACSRPIIAGRSGGIEDAVVDGVTGLLVQPEDVEEVAGAIARLASNPELARKFGQQGRARVLREFTWDQVGTKILGIMDQVMAAADAKRRA